MGLRHRRDERREERREFGRGGTATRYQMRQKLVSIGDDYWIENAEGQRVYSVDGKALRLRDTLDLEDADGDKLCRIQTRVMHIRDTMDIEGPDGERLALVHKALDHAAAGAVEGRVEAGPRLEVQGNIVDHEYEIEADGRKIAEVSKKWFRVRDTYGVEIEPGPGPGPDTRGHGRHRLDGPPRQVTAHTATRPCGDLPYPGSIRRVCRSSLRRSERSPGSVTR